MEWISVKDELPTDFDKHGLTPPYLVYIDNPFFENGNYHVAQYEASPFGEKYNHWRGIETNVAHSDRRPNVTHWMPLPEQP